MDDTLPSKRTARKAFKDREGSISNAERIAELNDQFRKFGVGCGRVMLTMGLTSLGREFKDAALKRVREFNDFTEGNNPHGENDFGSFELQGQKVFWRIDYYDRSLQNGSPDPSDNLVTCRVLTILLAEEY